MEINRQPQQPQQANKIVFDSVGKGAHEIKIVDAKNQEISRFAAEKIIQAEQKHTGMKIKGDSIHFNVIPESGKTNDIYRVSIKISDFARNETHLRNLIHYSGLNENIKSVQEIYPKELQEKIRELQKAEVKQPRNLKNLDAAKMGLSKDELKQIMDYYESYKEFLKSNEEPQFIARSETGFARSLVHIPDGPRQGLYILLKEHDGIKQVGVGT